MVIRVNNSVQKLIQGLEKPSISKFSRLIDLLEQFGNQLSMSYSKKIGDSLFELRIRGRQEVRIFYTFHQGRAVLLHGFVKKSQKTPTREIETARNHLKKLIKIS